MELGEVSQLLDVSKEQYMEILSIVQRHTDETVSWLSNMAAEFSWVGQAVSNSSSNPECIFCVTKVRNPGQRKRSHDQTFGVTISAGYYIMDG